MDIIGIDLDGTLLNAKNQISAKNIEAIQAAQAQGVEVVIATGRATFDVRHLFRKFDIKTWVIGANGATIHRPDGSLFTSTPINKEDVETTLSWLEKEGFYYEAIDDHSIFTPQNGREILQIELDRIRSANPEANLAELKKAVEKQFSQTGFLQIDSYKTIMESGRDIYNILAFSFHHEKLKKGWLTFESYPALTLVSSADHNFEIEHRQASKGKALEHLASHLDLSLSRTAVIGDSLNDLSMISAAGYSAAMGNAKKEVKDACLFQSKTNDEDGVAHAIYHFLSL
ncbi:Cof-type HAD-IIB family hydrolase [Halobacillus karajensis]|uniref:Phosphatase YwpJ n=1 Tax=Halobacillus karajensis TaxID=195088 RepID=A0A059NYZ1_9BACI|nr:Cof-type HAD-IIB family hydrolase [Halobacillus karajensis]CDQ18432.1 putative phosphatase YwpJ [Halobacillus karajensis]CDQ23496.1 putative phosphatase YwpJ [Halobacillus karajensis]CDQ26978.1 putative phosphatase YwpJ [Halobacillus karajensis]